MYTQNTYQQRRQSHQQPYQSPQPQPKPEPAPQRTFPEVVDFCKQMRLEAEVVGRWVWVSFAQKPSREIIQQLKDFGFHWSPRREKWAHNCGVPSQPGTGDPWISTTITPSSRTAPKTANATSTEISKGDTHEADDQGN